MHKPVYNLTNYVTCGSSSLSFSFPPSLTDIDTLLGDRFTSAAFLNSHVRNIEERPIE